MGTFHVEVSLQREIEKTSSGAASSHFALLPSAFECEEQARCQAQECWRLSSHVLLLTSLAQLLLHKGGLEIRLHPHKMIANGQWDFALSAVREQRLEERTEEHIRKKVRSYMSIISDGVAEYILDQLNSPTRFEPNRLDVPDTAFKNLSLGQPPYKGCQGASENGWVGPSRRHISYVFNVQMCSRSRRPRSGFGASACARSSAWISTSSTSSRTHTRTPFAW